MSFTFWIVVLVMCYLLPFSIIKGIKVVTRGPIFAVGDFFGVSNFLEGPIFGGQIIFIRVREILFFTSIFLLYFYVFYRKLNLQISDLLEHLAFVFIQHMIFFDVLVLFFLE